MPTAVEDPARAGFAQATSVANHVATFESLMRGLRAGAAPQDRCFAVDAFFAIPLAPASYAAPPLRLATCEETILALNPETHFEPPERTFENDNYYSATPVDAHSESDLLPGRHPQEEITHVRIYPWEGTSASGC